MRKIGKKLLALFMVTSLMFAVGCGGSKKETTTDGGETTQSAKQSEEGEEKDGTYSMTFIMPTRNEFNTSMEDGMISYCSENGISFTSQDANQDSSKLIQYVETAKNAGDDAVIVLPIDSETIPQIVEAAGDMKVIIVNRAPSDMSVFTGSVAYVGSKESDAGKYQGEYVASVLKEKGETVAKVIFLLGTVGAENTVARTDSAKQALEDSGLEVEVVNELGAQWSRSEALTKIQPLLTTTDYNCIIANNDDMALGAIEALTASNIDPTTVPVVGIDATVDGIQGIEEGTLDMTVFQDAKGQGIGSVAAAVNLLEGNSDIADGTEYTVDESNSNVVWIPFQPVTAENVSEYK